MASGSRGSIVEIEVESTSDPRPTPTRTTVPPALCAFGAAYNYGEILPCEYCGDGTVQASEGEVCDDGNNTDGDDCDQNCQSEICLFGAAYNYGEILPCEWCGDVIINGSEGCDDGNSVDDDTCSNACVVN